MTTLTSLRPSVALLAVGLWLSVPFTQTFAENVDPNGDGFQFIYGENVGWFNLEPLGNGGPGLQVSDFELTGWIWGENVGWVSLSCENTGSCSTARFGVWNDTLGNLYGLAWGENVGWINFKPMFAGVQVDPVTGIISGRAWAENVGWITFGSLGPVLYNVTTSWRCSPNPGEVGDSLIVGPPSFSGAVTISWTDSGPAGSHYNTYVGSVGAGLMSSRPIEYDHVCLESDDSASDGRTVSEDPIIPPVGTARYYLVSAELGCEGPLGTATDGRPRTNFSSCPSPP